MRAALGYPGAYEDFPWGEQVAKVNKKIFAFLGSPGAPASRVGLKLPDSHDFARTFPGVEPIGYGLGKAGWVNVDLDLRHGPPMDLVLDWLDESFRALAPKHLVARLDEHMGTVPP